MDLRDEIRALEALCGEDPAQAGSRLQALRDRYRAEPGRFDADSIGRLRELGTRLASQSAGTRGPTPDARRQTPEELSAALKQHFGFDAFRPHQEAIIRGVLAGRDVLAVLPTGGGKSLTYQL
ncbi:MAG TPA: hypothetical protein VJ600_02675, partial [Holophagaceae bacterium]|nr:hypothetical protein [Holophagaceae bacterium]